MPRRFKNNAIELLNYFDKNGEKITFNSAGTIFIDQVSLPNSNIFEIFPILFRKNSSRKQVPCLYDFIERLEQLGLAHLISIGKKKNLKVRKNNLKKRAYPKKAQIIGIWVTNGIGRIY